MTPLRQKFIDELELRGLSPLTREVSALLVDTRTGYLYAAHEVTEWEATLATSWGSQDAADQARQHAERRAFAKLVDDFATSWAKVLAGAGVKI